MISYETIALTDFKFLCPFCNQHLACVGSQRGTRIQCPSCQKDITVPASLRLIAHSDAVWTDDPPSAPLPKHRI